MNYCQDSKWGSELVCGGTSNTECIIINETASFCACSNGFKRDFTFLRQPDCTLPPYFLTVVESIAGIVHVLIAIWALIAFRRLKALAKKIPFLIFLQSIFFCALVISRGLENHEQSGRSFGLLLVCNFFAASACYLVLFSVLSPLYDAARISIKGLKLGLVAFFLTIRIAAALAVAFSMLKDDKNDPSTYQAYSNITISYYLIVEFEGFVIGTIIVILARRLKKMLQSVAHLNNSQSGLNSYLERIRRLVPHAAFIVMNMILLIIVFVILQFSMGSFPYFYIFNICVICQFPLIGIAALHYVSHENYLLTIRRRSRLRDTTSSKASEFNTGGRRQTITNNNMNVFIHEGPNHNIVDLAIPPDVEKVITSHTG